MQTNDNVVLVNAAPRYSSNTMPVYQTTNANKNLYSNENTQEKLDLISKKIEDSKKSISTVNINQNEDIWWSNRNAMTISSIVLIYSFSIVLIAAGLILKRHTSDSILKIFGVILIITSAVFLVVAGYSDQQISPVIGLLGTLAGYLLGKDTKEPTSSTSPTTKQTKKVAP